MSDERIEQHVRRLVGVVTLRRLKKMAEAESAAESRNAVWARRIIIALVVLMALFIGSLWLRQILD